MDYGQALNIATIGLGALTTCLSALLGLYFARFPKPLSRAFAFMLAGEAFVGAATTLFATTAAIGGGLTILSPAAQTAVRWAMFIATGASSIHLALVVYRLEHGRS